MHYCCQKDFFINSSCRALAEVQIQVLLLAEVQIQVLLGSQSYEVYSYLLYAVYVLIILNNVSQ